MNSKLNMEKKKLITFFMIILSGAVVYFVIGLKDILYVPFRDSFKMSNVQYGMCLSVTGTIGTFGYLLSSYISDRFKVKHLFCISLLGTAVTAFYFSTIPSFYGMLMGFALLGIFSEITFWPTLLKAVRLLGNKEEQGTLFGFLEGGRAFVYLINSTITLAIFSYFGESLFGFKVILWMYGVYNILCAIAAYRLLDDYDFYGEISSNERNKKALQGVLKAIKTKEVWILALTVASAYTLYMGIAYFVPFLTEVMLLPITFAGIYGMINNYGIRFISGPMIGIIADKKFKSSTRAFRIVFVLIFATLVLMQVMPFDPRYIYFVLVICLVVSLFICSLRGIYFAPVAELDVPKEISGATMSIASFIGYAPTMVGYMIYGSFLDKYPGAQGYKIVFTVMLGAALIGFIISSILWKMVKSKKNTDTVVEG